MTLPSEIVAQEPHWLDESSPCSHVVVTSRARYARNLADHLFAPHAPPAVLERVREEIGEALGRNAHFNDYFCLEMTEVTGTERSFLKESRLISKEMERGGANRAVYVAADFKCSIMVNEEDHLRIQCLQPGLQINAAQTSLARLDEAIGGFLRYAFHQRYGFLTACPTNVGTGLRVSVMMHLPGLVLRREVEKALVSLPKLGLTARGFHGENSENIGDFYQISNEVTLGKPVEEIEGTLVEAVNLIMEREHEARSLLTTRSGITVQDAIWRSYGVLIHARKMDFAESMKLLSRVRLGIDEAYFPKVSHELLNKLIVEIQPGHLIFRHGASENAEERDIARANLIRKHLGASK